MIIYTNTFKESEHKRDREGKFSKGGGDEGSNNGDGSKTSIDNKETLNRLKDVKNRMEKSLKGRIKKQTIREVFGKRYAGVKGKEAIGKLRKVEGGYIANAFKDGVSGEGVYLTYGFHNKETNKGFGLKHIDERRTLQGIDLKKFYEALPDTIERGIKGKKDDERVRADDEKHKQVAIIPHKEQLKRIRFLLTAYLKEKR
jgi:hypothetical protein